MKIFENNIKTIRNGNKNEEFEGNWYKLSQKDVKRVFLHIGEWSHDCGEFKAI